MGSALSLCTCIKQFCTLGAPLTQRITMVSYVEHSMIHLHMLQAQGSSVLYWVQVSLVQIPISPLTSCVTLNKLFNLSSFSLLIYKIEIIGSTIKDTIFVEYFAPCLTPINPRFIISHSFNKYLSRSKYVSGTVLIPGNTWPRRNRFLTTNWCIGSSLTS